MSWWHFYLECFSSSEDSLQVPDVYMCFPLKPYICDWLCSYYCSVAKQCPTLCWTDPRDCSSPGSSVLQYLPVCSNSCPFESVMLFNHLILCPRLLLWPQSFPASGSFPVTWPFPSHGQSITASASASVLPRNIQDWFPFGLTGLISVQCKGLSRIFSSTTIWKHQFFSTYSVYGATFTSIHEKS